MTAGYRIALLVPVALFLAASTFFVRTIGVVGEQVVSFLDYFPCDGATSPAAGTLSGPPSDRCRSAATVARAGPFTFASAKYGPDYSLIVNGKQFPLMFRNGHGAGHALLGKALNALVAPRYRYWTVVALDLLLGVAAVLAVAYLARPLGGPAVAVLAASLAALDLSFALLRHFNLYAEAIVQLGALVFLGLVCRFNHTRRTAYLYAASFVLGVALHEKVTVLVVVLPGLLIAAPRNVTRAQALRAILLVAAGGAISLLYVVLAGPGAVARGLAERIDASRHGPLLHNLAESMRWAFVVTTDQGRMAALLLGTDPVSRAHRALSGALLVLALGAPLLAWLLPAPSVRPARQDWRIWLRVLLCVAGCALLWSTFRHVSGSTVHYYVDLVPFLCILQASAAVTLAGRVRSWLGPRRVLLTGGAVALCVAVIAVKLRTFHDFRTIFRDRADTPVWSYAIQQQMLQTLEHRGIAHPLMTCYEMSGVFEYLSAERIRPMFHSSARLAEAFAASGGGYYLANHGADPMNRQPDPTAAEIRDLGDKLRLRVTRVACSGNAANPHLLCLYRFE